MIFLGITLKRVYYGVVYELKQLINDFGCIFYGFENIKMPFHCTGICDQWRGTCTKNQSGGYWLLNY